MSEVVALTGIIVLRVVVGVVAVVGIVFGVAVRSKAQRDGVELAVEAPHQATLNMPTTSSQPKGQQARKQL